MVLSTQRGTIVRQAVRDIALQSRTATGVRVQRLDEGNHILSVAMLPEVPDDDDDGADGSSAAVAGGAAGAGVSTDDVVVIEAAAAAVAALASSPADEFDGGEMMMSA